MTELIWEGKYKDDRKVTPIRIALPFQTIETVNESAQQRQKTLDFFVADPGSVYSKEWRNRLIWGDKKYVLPSLLPEFGGKVNLIYIDPPFNVGADFSFTATIPDNPETDDDDSAQFVKEPSIIEQKAYRDTWGKGLDSYMQWLYESAIILKELLTNDGSIYVHLDWHVVHYAKAIMDEIFGYENFQNEIIWKRKGGSALSKMNKMSINTDTILYYTKGNDFTFNNIYMKPDSDYVEQMFTKVEKDGRRFMLNVTSSPTYRPNLIYDFKGYKTPPKGWRYSKEKMEELDKKGLIYYPDDKSKQVYKKIYLDEYEGQLITNLWTDISLLKGKNVELLNYDTQKPEALLERILKVSSNENDLVLDCFCGSGTTAAVSEKLNRKWIVGDLGRFAIHTTRKRLLGINNLKPFIVQNLGKYERQQWMLSEFENPENIIQQEKAYKHFIIELYHARPLNGYIWLHGAKAGRMVHVGSVDAPVAVDDIKSTIREFWKLIGKDKSVQTNGIDFLGWDFAFDINETAKQFAAENKVDVAFKKIPREVLEKKAVEQGDIKFYELASLNIKSKKENKKLSLSLENFIIPPDDVPQEVQGKITHWSQWIDYWAVDWNYRDDTFHNEWQSYRTKQNPKIDLEVSHVYDNSGEYTVLIKVIDILGNDTTKILHIHIK